LTGPRKAKEKAMKDAGECHNSDILNIVIKSTKYTYMLAWFEAERKKRPRSPNADASEHEENLRGKSGESTSTRNEGMS
jgi:hypothetical protein